MAVENVVDCTPEWEGMTRYVENCFRSSATKEVAKVLILAHFPEAKNAVYKTLKHLKDHGASQELLDFAKMELHTKHGPDKYTFEEREMFEYLRGLRRSGVTNMLGAGEYLEVRFDIDKRTASKVLGKWLNDPEVHDDSKQ